MLYPSRTFLEIFALALAHGLSLFYRSLLSVISPELSADLAIDESQLGLLSATVFITFALMQVPLGIAFDHFGPRRVIATVMLSAVLGAGVLAGASNYWMAILGQALIGIGCAPVFTGAMVIIARGYPAERFALLSASVLTFATLGDLLSTAPFATLAEYVGWRGGLWIAVSLTALSSVLCWLFIRDSRTLAEGQSQETLLQLFSGWGELVRVVGLWPIFPLLLGGYAVLLCVRGLWGGPYLADMFGLDPSGRGIVLMCMSLAMALGTIGYGLAPRVIRSAKLTIGIGSALAIVSLTILAIAGSGPLTSAVMLLCVLGLFGATYPLLMDHCRRFVPPYLMGRGMALLTLICFAGVAAVQAGSGALIEAAFIAGWPIQDRYALLFGALAVTLAVALVAYSFSQEAPFEAGSMKHSDPLPVNVPVKRS
ncbi:MFS transporter [Pontibacterium granulatum]|uniref:MFS transporter n=1 Tax=Pontibacterium granulatum TaxID=2036029 RepID=UPI00249B77E9|nr:MFS transporter [Pontibacterium granulatum]MDI3324374.1 MFS transporter [Pontibacterium granulatum]